MGVEVGLVSDKIPTKEQGGTRYSPQYYKACYRKMTGFFVLYVQSQRGANTAKLPNCDCKNSHRPCSKKFVVWVSRMGAGAGAPTKE